MKHKTLKFIMRELAGCSIRFEQGLSDDELLCITDKFGVVFPPDLQAFLQMGLPTSVGFFDWRVALTHNDGEQMYHAKQAWLIDGILFDMRQAGFWLDAWGTKPTSQAEQTELVRHHLHQYPTLIPTYAHHYLPMTPHDVGNPVFPVYQTDVIYYGYDLADYFSREFGFALPDDISVAHTPRKIAFWGELVTLSG